MKEFAIPLALLCLCFAVPALSQDTGKEGELAAQVKSLTEQVDKLNKSVASLEARVEAEKLASAALTKQLKKARKDGFTFPAPNIEAKEALLGGLESFAADRAK